MEKCSPKSSVKFGSRTLPKKVQLEKLYQNLDFSMAPIKESLFPDDMQDIKEALSVISLTSSLKPEMTINRMNSPEDEKPASSSPKYRSFKIRRKIKIKK